jgi:hypothetical protein
MRVVAGQPTHPKGWRGMVDGFRTFLRISLNPISRFAETDHPSVGAAGRRR